MLNRHIPCTAPVGCFKSLRQVAKCEDELLLIRAIWPGRTGDTGVLLGQLREDGKLIINDHPGLMPKAFEFMRVIDLAGNFRGASKFVEYVVPAVPNFYKEIGQYLKAWVPSAPKVEDEIRETLEEPATQEVKEQAAPLGELPVRNLPVLHTDNTLDPDSYQRPVIATSKGESVAPSVDSEAENS